jgi:hypothetical protein
MHRRVAGTKDQYTITVPASLARAATKAGAVTFTCEATDEGILYRPVINPPDPLAAPPAWLQPKGTP